MDIKQTHKGYEIETESLDIEIADGRILASMKSGMPFRELDGKKFADNESALEFIKNWHEKQIAWASKNTVIGF